MRMAEMQLYSKQQCPEYLDAWKYYPNRLTEEDKR